MGRKGRKQRYTAQRLFKQEELEKTGGKGDIDGFRYRREILVPILYPFYEAIQAANPDVTLWLIEDNAPAHTRAARQCEENRRLRSIQKCVWPPDSSDLHAIEDLWGPENSLVRPKLFDIKGASKEAQKKARLVIEEV